MKKKSTLTRLDCNVISFIGKSLHVKGKVAYHVWLIRKRADWSQKWENKIVKNGQKGRIKTIGDSMKLKPNE